MKRRLTGRIVTPGGVVDGTLDLGADGRIAAVTGTPVPPERVRDHAGPFVLPGFIDLHVHGGGGHDVMEGGQAGERIARMHAEHGTTSLLATTMTAPPEDLDRAFAGLRDLHRERPRGAARLLGVHLEGPYIHPGRLGAQPDFTRPVDLAEVRRWHAQVPIRLVTLAPEAAHNEGAIEALVGAGFKVQLGHTTGSYEAAVDALRRGASGFTHLYNAMSGMHHREPGMVGAALAHATYAEIIPDLLHVHPGAIRAALRAIPCLYCVTDSTAAAGMPDGEYHLGRQPVTKCLGGVRLADGTLAGSTLTMDEALRNWVDRLGLSLDDAARRTATFAADHVGEPHRGRLAPGAWADVVVLDRDLRVAEVLVEGE